MAPNRKYANYPGAREAPTQVKTETQKEDQNPVLRGWPLVAGATAYVLSLTHMLALELTHST